MAAGTANRPPKRIIQRAAIRTELRRQRNENVSRKSPKTKIPSGKCTMMTCMLGEIRCQDTMSAPNRISGPTDTPLPRLLDWRKIAGGGMQCPVNGLQVSAADNPWTGGAILRKNYL